jgi:hypothetical protein
VLAPDHQQARLLLPHPRLPLGIGLYVRPIVAEEVALCRPDRLAEKREFIRPQIRS